MCIIISQTQVGIQIEPDAEAKFLHLLHGSILVAEAGTKVEAHRKGSMLQIKCKYCHL